MSNPTNFLIGEKVKSNNFDILRFLLATAVIVCHSYVIYYGYETFAQVEPFMKWTSGNISIGTTAVFFFFAISGFLIMKSYESSHTVVDYLKKRVLRIFPGFFVAFAVSIFIVAPLGNMYGSGLSGYLNYFREIPLWRELANMLSLQAPADGYYFNNLPQPGLNESLWTIQYEFICYFMLPLLALFGILKNRMILLICFIGCYSLYFLQDMGVLEYTDRTLINGVIENPYYYARFFTYFLAGCTIYAYREKIPGNFWLAAIAFIYILMALNGLVSVHKVLPIAGVYLLFYVAYHPKIKLPGFSKYGDFSYGIYLYGWPVQQLVMMNFGDMLSPLQFFIVVFVTSLGLAIISWNLIEQPVLALKRFGIKPIFRKALLFLRIPVAWAK